MNEHTQKESSSAETIEATYSLKDFNEEELGRPVQQLAPEEIDNKTLNSFSGNFSNLSTKEKDLIMSVYNETLWVLGYTAPPDNAKDISRGMIMDHLLSRAKHICDSGYASNDFLEIFNTLKAVIIHSDSEEVTDDIAFDMIYDYFHDILEKGDSLPA